MRHVGLRSDWFGILGILAAPVALDSVPQLCHGAIEASLGGYVDGIQPSLFVAQIPESPPRRDRLQTKNTCQGDIRRDTDTEIRAGAGL